MKTAIVIGCTGLVGAELLKLLLADPGYRWVIVLNRRPAGVTHPKLIERILDFDRPELTDLEGNDFYCALGTTLRKAGSEAAQHTIDCEYPTAIATSLRKRGVRRIFLVSSLGANPHSRRFYLRTKGRLEENIIGLHFDRTVIARPSLLLGRRAENRRGERLAIVLMKMLAPVLRGGFARYRAVEASKVARCLVNHAALDASGLKIVESDEI